MGRGIRLSEKHGLNPSLMMCFFCGESMGVALCGRLPHDEEAPSQMVVSLEPCDTCRERRKTHVHLIAVTKEGLAMLEADSKNPNVPRTGESVWIPHEMLNEFVQPESVAEQTIKHGWSFVPAEAFDIWGIRDKLPKDGSDGEVILRKKDEE